MMTFTNHQHCLVLSSLFRGKLCDQLTGRAGRRLSAKEFLYLIGDRAQSIYFLRRGLVKSSVVSAQGEELILRMHKPGEIFGEFCLCDGQRREQAVAMEESEVVEIGFGELISHLQNNPQALSDFLTSVCQRLSEAYEQLRTFSFDKTLERLGRTLLKLTEDLGEPTPEGVKIAHFIRQEELAQMIAASREVVSSSLNRMREMGLVNYSRKGQLTVNTKALQTYLGDPVNLHH